MKLYSLETEQWFPQTIEDVFRFFASAANLERITPPWLNFHIVSPPVEMRAGARIDYRLKLHGIPLRWQSEITVWEPPVRFVDVQTRGPYRSWTHEHVFEARDAGTLVRDNVRYAVWGGHLVRKLFVEPDLKRVFDFRRACLQSIFSAGPNHRATPTASA